MINIVKRSLLAVSALALAFGILAAGSIPAASGRRQLTRCASSPRRSRTRTPSFVAPLGDYLAWTGSYKGVSKMYLYDLLAGQNAYINPGPSGSYYNPAAEGDYVVFQGATTGGYERHLPVRPRCADRLRSSAPWASMGTRDDWNPRIQGGRVVWEKDTADPATGSGIYLYDIGTRDKRLIIAGPEYRDPISGATTWCASRT